MGSSGLACSAHDLGIWLQNNQDPRVGGQTAHALVVRRSETPTGSETDYVFGNWHSQRDGRRMVGHQGLAAGFRTSVHAFPDDGLAVIYLANDGNDATYERVRAIEDIFMGVQAPKAEAPNQDYTPSEPAAMTDEEVAPLLGRYYADELLAEYEIVRVGQRIAARHPGTGLISLSPQGSDTFASDKWFAPSFHFFRDAAGKVDGFFRFLGGFRCLFCRLHGEELCFQVVRSVKVVYLHLVLIPPHLRSPPSAAYVTGRVPAAAS